MPKYFVRLKILLALLWTKTSCVKIKHPQLLWLSFDLERPTGTYNIYIRNPHQEVGQHQIFWGPYATGESIVTPLGKIYEGNKRVPHYQEIKGMSVINEIIYLVAKRKLNADVKRAIQVVEAEFARKKQSETIVNQLSEDLRNK